MVRYILPPKREEVKGDWRKQHSDEFHEMTSRHSLFGYKNKGRQDEQDM